ncbi:MAG: hypothetical protein IJD04_05830 [Desulfovibrionaceae bacterium]|nr:hypothetical protein [Desulfovibrionaceae bacterium]
MKKFTIGIMMTGMLLSGCASKYGEQITEVNHYPNCYSPIAELRSAESDVQTGAGAGALIGAFMGALAGYAATGKGYGAIAGAAAGATVGAVAGYGLAKHKTESNIRTRLSNYAQAVGADVAQMDTVAASASQARQCYEAAFAAARGDFMNKRITAQEFEARYLEIRSGLLETASILNDVSVNMTARDKEYRETLAWEASQRNLPAPNTEVYSVASSNKKGSKNKPVKASPDPDLDQMAKRPQLLKTAGQPLNRNGSPLRPPLTCLTRTPTILWALALNQNSTEPGSHAAGLWAGRP